MTIEVKIKDGKRYTLWNVEELSFQDNSVFIHHIDRKPTIIAGQVEKIVRRDN